jgi:ornithine cyclodeaminase/alanine dehydrogenase-like protein (mu-crystallin family)
MIDVLTDADVRRLLTPERAIEWMREALVAEHRGQLQSPPRVHTDLGSGRLVFTTGSVAGMWFGYRSYDTFGLEPGEQVVVVHNAADGRVRGIAVGNELGSRRVGAIGGVAADLLAHPDSSSLAIVGTGIQAWAQLCAVSAVRDLAEIRVHSRSPERRRAFVARAQSELGLTAHAVPDARDAVEGAHIVVLATNSPTPVIDADWLAGGIYITTVGPKQVGHAEFDTDLVAACDTVFTDSVSQISAYDPPNILVGTTQEHRLRSLGAVLAGDTPGRTSAEQRILFCSVGLAGTESFLLDRLLRLTGLCVQPRESPR